MLGSAVDVIVTAAACDMETMVPVRHDRNGRMVA